MRPKYTNDGFVRSDWVVLSDFRVFVMPPKGAGRGRDPKPSNLGGLVNCGYNSKHPTIRGPVLKILVGDGYSYNVDPKRFRHKTSMWPGLEVDESWTAQVVHKLTEGKKLANIAGALPIVCCARLPVVPPCFCVVCMHTVPCVVVCRVAEEEGNGVQEPRRGRIGRYALYVVYVCVAECDLYNPTHTYRQRRGVRGRRRS